MAATCAAATSRTSTTPIPTPPLQPFSFRLPSNIAFISCTDVPSARLVCIGPITKDGLTTTRDRPSAFSAISMAFFSARVLERRYGPASKVLSVFQSSSVNTFSLSALLGSVTHACGGPTAARDDVTTTRLMPAFTAASITEVVPLRAGSTKSFCGSLQVNQKGEAVCCTYVQPSIAFSNASEPPNKSAANNSTVGNSFWSNLLTSLSRDRTVPRTLYF
mmetsp:Transcript_94772/g.149937  ORF Transcript_94772/g.149937 Transcript_94772/m.149937 type:complete len:219 (-) Transcript_94772:283-939(-)